MSTETPWNENDDLYLINIVVAPGCGYTEFASITLYRGNDVKVAVTLEAHHYVFDVIDALFAGMSSALAADEQHQRRLFDDPGVYTQYFSTI